MPHEACLSKLTEADLEELHSRSEVRSYGTGDVIVNEGDKVDELRILRVGNLRVGRSYKQNMLAEFTGPLGPGNAVSEVSFLDGGGASATLIADGDVELFVISRDNIETMIDADPSFAGRLYLSLFIEVARKLRATNQRVLPTEP